METGEASVAAMSKHSPVVGRVPMNSKTRKPVARPEVRTFGRERLRTGSDAMLARRDQPAVGELPALYADTG